jgi:hypothetical protein
MSERSRIQLSFDGDAVTGGASRWPRLFEYHWELGCLLYTLAWGFLLVMRHEEEIPIPQKDVVGTADIAS